MTDFLYRLIHGRRRPKYKVEKKAWINSCAECEKQFVCDATYDAGWCNPAPVEYVKRF